MSKVGVEGSRSSERAGEANAERSIVESSSGEVLTDAPLDELRPGADCDPGVESGPGVFGPELCPGWLIKPEVESVGGSACSGMP